MYRCENCNEYGSSDLRLLLEHHNFCKPPGHEMNKVHRTVPNKEVELELDAIIGNPWRKSLAQERLKALYLSREDAIMQAFKNGCIAGVLVESAIIAIVWLLVTLS